MFTLQDLLYLMCRLRDPESGCPWDLKQNFASIVPHTLEEAYEVVDCIEREDYGQLRDELGDLLFQVVYYSQLAEEERCFNFHDVVQAIVAKLVRRHPHVFPDGDLYGRQQGASASDSRQIRATWERIKEQERAAKAQRPQQLSLLDDVPRVLPALSRAEKLQKRAATVGFDWPDLEAVADKMREELAELDEAMASADGQRITEELGDVLFTVVNMARHLDVDAEIALRGSSRRFEMRFRAMEQMASERGLTLSALSLDESDALWREAKKKTG